jgi:hypothetical protein
MRDAFAPLSSDGACLIVLTLDRYGTYSGEKRWENAQAAYRALSGLSNEFLKRLRKWMLSQGWKPLKNEWVATVEMHKSGWPHVNFVVHSNELADWIAREKSAKMSDGLSEHEANRISGGLADAAIGAGWGVISTAERARSREETLGYITKCSGKVDESIGELAKLCQLPTAAPFRFRRLRSGKGFLPKRAKNEQVTGTLLRRQLSQDGTYDVLNLHTLKNLANVEISAVACIHEENIWLAELEAKERCKRQVAQFGIRAVQLPPVTHWVGHVRVARVVRRSITDELLFGCAEAVPEPEPWRRGRAGPELSWCDSEGATQSRRAG